MAITDLKGSTESRWQITSKSGNTNLSDRKLKIRQGNIRSWRFGTGAGQINKNYAEKFNIAASGSQNVDLEDGTANDINGNPVVFTETRGFRVTHLPGSSASSIRVLGNFITVNLGAATILKDLAPGDYLDLNFKMTVTAATADVFTVTNNDGVEIADVAIEAIGIG